MEKQLAKWLEKGLITQEKYLELLEDCKIEKEKTRKAKIRITLYTIGAILLGVGIILFIAANEWLLSILAAVAGFFGDIFASLGDFFLKIFNYIASVYFLKIVFTGAVVLGFFWGGCKLYGKNSKLPGLADCLIFLSTLSLGGFYALIGQIYNTEANEAGIYFIWLLSIYPVAILFKNAAVNVLSCVLFIIGTILYFSNSDCECIISAAFFISAIFYCAGNIPRILEKFNGFSFCYKTISLVSIYILLLILTFAPKIDSPSNMQPVIFSFIFALIFNATNLLLNKKTPLLIIESIFIALISLLGFAVVTIDAAAAAIFANLLIIFLIAAHYYFGYKFEEEKLVNRATKFLVLYLIINYIKFGKNYLEGATYFISGGIILITGAILLEKNTKKYLKKKDSK